MRWFGMPYDLPFYRHGDKVDVPVGRDCLKCGLKIDDGDDGYISEWVTDGGASKDAVYHRNCLLACIDSGEWPST